MALTHKAAKVFVKQIKQFIELCRSGANKLKTFIDKIKRRAVQEAAPNRPTAK